VSLDSYICKYKNRRLTIEKEKKVRILKGIGKIQKQAYSSHGSMAKLRPSALCGLSEARKGERRLWAPLLTL
jgi:hypothetical protein